MRASLSPSRPSSNERGDRPVRAALVLAVCLAAPACAPPCATYDALACEVCGAQVEDYVCTCIADEKLGAGDYPEGRFPSDADASLACREYLIERTHADSDAEASCVAARALLERHGSAACEDVDVPVF